MENLIGQTPLTAIHYRFLGKEKTIYAKMEYYNMTGSIKDRMAFFILKEALRKGRIKPGMPVVAATSGNTGIAFAAVAGALGHKVHIFMPDWMSRERIDLIKSYGAAVHLVSSKEGGFLGSIEKANALAEEINGFRPWQFRNEDNCLTHYHSTGPEIYKQLEKLKKTPEVFVAGVGTGGTIMGVGKYLKEKNPQARIHPLEPSNSPTLSTGCKVGKHRIQGISDEFIPAILKLDQLDSVVGVDDGDSILMARALSANLGLGVGISSGANFLGAVKLQEKYKDKQGVVTVFADDNKKYLSTDYTKEIPLKVDFLSPGVELLGCDSICGQG